MIVCLEVRQVMFLKEEMVMIFSLADLETIKLRVVKVMTGLMEVQVLIN